VRNHKIVDGGGGSFVAKGSRGKGSWKGMSPGIELLVKTDKETIPFHLGPAYFIERLDVKIEKGDKIEVKGSRVTISGKPVIIAAEIKKGDSVFRLRDDAGTPVWSGWRR
jgi:hypothetical protein